MNQAFEFASVRKCLIFPYRENTLQIMNLVTAANIFLWRYFYFLEKQLLTYDLLAYAGQEPVLCKMHDKPTYLDCQNWASENKPRTEPY